MKQTKNKKETQIKCHVARMSLKDMEMEEQIKDIALPLNVK